MSPADAITNLILESFRLNGCLLAAGDALVHDLGLSSARWQVLGAVALSAAPAPVAHIARTIGLSRQNVQRIANELQASGLLEFAPNPHHQRAKLVVLTEHGRAVHAKAAARQRPWAAVLAKDLPKDAIDEATGLLRTLRLRLEAEQSSHHGRPA